MKVSAGASLKEVAKLMLGQKSHVAEVDDAGRRIGWIEALDLVKGLLSGNPDLKARDICQPVEPSALLWEDITVEELAQWYITRGRILPYFISQEDGSSKQLSPCDIVAELLGLKRQEETRRLAAEKAYHELREQLPLGIAVVDQEGQVLYSNALGFSIIKSCKLEPDYFREKIIRGRIEVLKGGRGRYYRVACSRITEPGLERPNEEGFLVLFTDVTSEYRLMDLLKGTRKEAEMALAVMLPDLRLTHRLQSIVEYRDEYDPSTGKIRITGRITEGVYRHVINILKLVADAFLQGLMDLPGIEKNVLVDVTIFHDLGKVQPELKIGDVVDPREVFEPGYKHAFRGAALAEGVYGLKRDTVLLIKYHHHEESELPPEFPEYLLPMYRLFRLLDGLSAGITRRGAKVKIAIKGSLILVEERSPVPQY
ncbi:MAG: HD domain-containing protein, partial [Moorellaceae bacterium]